jgi:hypothetical protein
MKIQRFATRLLYSTLALALLLACPWRVLAQAGHSHAEFEPALSSSQQTLLKAVRDSTARFQDVSVAESEGYALQFGCVTGPDSGAMGLHYINMSLVAAGTIDPQHPQIVIYEPTPDGHLKLIGADFLVIAEQWDKAHPGQGAPQLMGQLFQFFESPNRFGLPAFYTLHVWAWKPNPNGAFVNWHPHVSCQYFAGQ